MVFCFFTSLGQCILLLGYFTAFGLVLSNGAADAWNSNIVMALYYVLIPAAVSIAYVFLLRVYEKRRTGRALSARRKRGLCARAAAVILFTAIGYVLGVSRINEGAIMYFLCNFSLYIIAALFALGSILMDVFAEQRE